MRAGNTDSTTLCVNLNAYALLCCTDERQKKEVLWNGAIVSYLHNEFNYAQNFMNGYEQPHRRYLGAQSPIECAHP
jgi:hypothetical protein